MPAPEKLLTPLEFHHMSVIVRKLLIIQFYLISNYSEIKYKPTFIFDKPDRNSEIKSLGFLFSCNKKN